MKSWLNFILCCLFLVACKKTPVIVEPIKDKVAAAAPVATKEPVKAPEKPSVETVKPRIALYWENTTEAHPERAAWSDEVVKTLRESIAVFDTAKDINEFCPKYHYLSEDLRLKAWGELLVGTALFESAFNPASASVDVGKKSDKNTWSVGLFQISVVDQQSYKIPMGYVYSDLLKPIPNIHLALAILKKQIQNRGYIVVPSNPYWATLYRKKYSKVDSIIARTKKYAPACLN
ncbi:MAG: transglycosylase SLT domain-containing protein [Pseudobdellovibrionaceae bacterium]